MFILPAASSLVIDVLLIVAYTSFLDEKNLYDFIVVWLAAGRILLLFPLTWHYFKSQKFHYALSVRRWEMLMMVLLLTRLIFVWWKDNTWDIHVQLTLGSLTATFFNFWAVGHMKSSVEMYLVKPKHIFLRMDKTRHGLVTDTKPYSASIISLEEVEEGTYSQTLGIHKGELRNMGIHKGELRNKWKDLLQSATDQLSGFMQGASTKPNLNSPFYLFLRLFAYHDVMDQIDEGFERDPEGFEFYIMQLVMFLLYRSFLDSDRAEALILNRCRHSLLFGHQVFWVLRAFGEEGANIDREGQTAIRNVLEEVCMVGETPGLYLSQGQGPGEGLEGVRFPLERFTRHSVADNTASFNQPPEKPSSPKAGTSRPVLHQIPRYEELLRQSSTDFSENLSTIESVGCADDNTISSLDVSNEGFRERQSELSPRRLRQFESERLSSSRDDSDSDVSSQQTNQSAMDSIMNLLGSLQNTEDSTPAPIIQLDYQYPESSVYFTPELQFIDKLVNVAASLHALPKWERNRALRRQLRQLNKQSLPSRLLYLPIGNTRHRIYKIHASESFSFSTKERTPILVCCEVLDYSRLGQRASMGGTKSAPARSMGWKQESGPLATPVREQPFGRTTSHNPYMASASKWWTRPRHSSLGGGPVNRGIFGYEATPPMRNQPALRQQSIMLKSSNRPPAIETQQLLQKSKLNFPWFTSKNAKESALAPGAGNYGTNNASAEIELGELYTNLNDTAAFDTTPKMNGNKILDSATKIPSEMDVTNGASAKQTLEEENTFMSPRRPNMKPDSSGFTVRLSEFSRSSDFTKRNNDTRKLKLMMGQWYAGAPTTMPNKHSKKDASRMKKFGQSFIEKIQKNLKIAIDADDDVSLGSDVQQIDSDEEDQKSTLGEILGSHSPSPRGAKKETVPLSTIKRRDSNPRLTYPPLRPVSATREQAILNEMESGEHTSENVGEGLNDPIRDESTAVTPLRSRRNTASSPVRSRSNTESRQNHLRRSSSADQITDLKGRVSVAFVDEEMKNQEEDRKAVVEDSSPTVIFKESWSDKENRIRAKSPIGHLPGWRLVPVIIKADDDLRQEMIVSQLIKQIAGILQETELPVYIRPYDIIATSHNSGIIEAIPDTVSLDALKKNDLRFTTLYDFFDRHFGWEGSPPFIDARRCFVESLSAYSILCYLLNVKDRHNGNILLDSEGHMIHIDFGFVFARTPGNANFESAPFKLTAEWIELMGGPSSNHFKRFRQLCCDTFMALRKHLHKITLLVEMMAHGNEHLPCFGNQPEEVISELTKRFRPDLHDKACISYVNHLIDDSMHNWRTTFYDKYQQCFVGIKD